jgi:hypothetical protein
MTTEPNVLKARNKMLAALDHKLKNDPTWQAFRAIDDLFIAGLNGAASAHTENESHANVSRRRAPRGRGTGHGRSVGDMGVAAITAANRPVPTDEMVAYVAARRKVNPDPRTARINVQSAMSHEARIVSVKWRGGTAWWLKDREVPNED